MQKTDLTSGPLLPGILRLAGPAVLMMLLQGFYNYVDTYFVGHLGADALAGISTGSFILWMTFALAHLMGVGVGAKVARRIGEQDRNEADRTALRGMIYTLVWAAMVAGGLALIAPQFFRLMHTPLAVTDQGMTYLTPLVIGMPLIFLSFTVNTIFISAGDSRTPFLIMFLSLLLNALLDPLLIFGWAGFPELGIAGAAWATVAARLFWLLLAFRLLLRPDGAVSLNRHGKLGAGLADAMSIVRIGAPKAATGVLFSGVYMALTRITSHFGTPNIAALRIGHIYEGLSFFVALGFSVAAGALVGQNLGARQVERARHGAWMTVGLVVVYACGVGLLFRLAAPHLAAMFSDDAAVIQAAAAYLLILAWSQPFMSAGIVLEGGFSGAGNTVPPMVVQIPLMLARYPVGYLLAFHTGLGIDGVWWAISGSSMVVAISLGFWFRRGRWVGVEV